MEKKITFKGDAEIGRRVRVIRENKSMTQRKLAEKVMVSPSSIARLESGQTMVSVFTIIRIAEVLNTPVSFLLSGCAEDLDLSVHQSKEKCSFRVLNIFWMLFF